MTAEEAAEARRAKLPEDAMRLQFGERMSGVKAQFLTTTEAAFVLEAVSGSAAGAGPDKKTEAFKESLEYAMKLGLGAGGTSDAARASTDELRKQLLEREFASGADGDGGAKLHMYEVASLGNLRPSNPAAAKSLVPSLSRFDDSDVRAMLIVVGRCTARLDD